MLQETTAEATAGRTTMHTVLSYKSARPFTRSHGDDNVSHANTNAPPASITAAEPRTLRRGGMLRRSAAESTAAVAVPTELSHWLYAMIVPELVGVGVVVGAKVGVKVAVITTVSPEDFNHGDCMSEVGGDGK